MTIDIDQIAGLRTALDDLTTKVNAAYTPLNKPAIADITGLAAALTAITPIMARGGWAGFQLAPAAGSNSKYTISPGMVRDSTNTADIILAAGLTKDINNVFVAGNNGGSKSANVSYGNSGWFHVYIGLNTTTGAVDSFTDQSATNPVLPAGITKFRRIRGLLTDANGNLYPFREKPGSYIQKIPRGAEFAGQPAPPASGSLKQLHVPRGIKCKVLGFYQSTTSNVGPNYAGPFDPDDGAPPTFGIPTQWAEVRQGADYQTHLTGHIWTDTNGQVYMASNDANNVWALGSVGYHDYAETWGV